MLPGLEGNIMDGNYGWIDTFVGLMVRGVAGAAKFAIKAGYAAYIESANNGNAEAQYEVANGLWNDYNAMLKNVNYRNNFSEEQIDAVTEAVFDYAEKSADQGYKKADLLLEHIQ
jgi:hypothetical protein